MADREIRYLFRKKESSGSILPNDGMIGEPFVNTHEGRLFFYGTSGGTYIPVCGQTNVFEIGSNVEVLNAKYIYSAGTDLYTIFSAGTNTNSGGYTIQSGINTYTGGTFSSQTVNVSAATLDSLSVSGASSLAILSAITIYSGGTDLYDIFESSPTSPGGIDGSIQYNVDNYFSGDSTFKYIQSANTIYLNGTEIQRTNVSKRLSISNVVEIPAGTGGAFGCALDGRVSCPADASRGISDDQLSIEFWIYFVSGYPYILYMTGGYYFLFFGDVRFVTTQGTVSVNASYCPSNTWTHLVGTYDGSYMRLYANGIEVGNTPATGNLIDYAYAYPLHIVLPAYNDFIGKIDEARLYHKCLTPIEVVEHYNAGVGIYGTPEADLLGLWHFDDMSGAVAIDSSGNGYDADITGTYVWNEGHVGTPTTLTLAEAISYKNSTRNNSKGDINIADDVNTYVGIGIESPDAKLCVNGDFRVSGNTYLQTVSASTIISGSTDLYDIFESSPTNPGGFNTYIQYNYNNVFSGNSNFTWSHTGNTLELGETITGSKALLTLKAKNTGDAVIKVRNSVDNADVFIVSGSGNATLGQLTTTGPKTFMVACYDNPRIVLGTGYSTDTGIFSLTRRYYGTVTRFNDNVLLLYHNSFLDGNNMSYKMHFVNPSSYYGVNTALDGYNAGFMWFKDSAIPGNIQMKLSPDNALSLYNSTNSPIETGFTDSFQFYSRDVVDGNAAPHFKTESGNIIKLYTESAVTSVQGIADALTNIGLLTSSIVTEKYTTGTTINDNEIFFDRSDLLSAYSFNLSSTTVFNDVTEIKNIVNVSDNWGGFTNNENIFVSYDYDTRTISLSGSFQMYYRGKLILDYSTGGTWTSDVHTSGQTSNLYLFYNESGFQWSNSSWNFSDVQIAVVYNDYLGYKFASREVHGLMDWESHQTAHFAIGTYKRSGGDFSGWIANSTTAANRRPNVSATRIADEDLISNLSSLTSKTYTRFHLSGANSIAVFTTGSTDFLGLSTNQPYYNQYTGTIWQQALMSNNAYQAIFVLAVPTANDGNSTQYRYLWVQGQTQNTTLATIQGLTTDSVNLGTFATTAPEFVFIAKIIIRYTSGNWIITSIQSLTGSRFNQVAAPSGNYLSSVNTDSSLTGDGTTSNPLAVASNQTLNILSAATINTTTISASTVTTDEIISVNGIYITDSDRNKTKVGTWKFYIDGGDLKVAKLTGGTEWVIASTFTV